MFRTEQNGRSIAEVVEALGGLRFDMHDLKQSEKDTTVAIALLSTADEDVAEGISAALTNKLLKRLDAVPAKPLGDMSLISKAVCAADGCAIDVFILVVDKEQAESVTFELTGQGHPAKGRQLRDMAKDCPKWGKSAERNGFDDAGHQNRVVVTGEMPATIM